MTPSALLLAAADFLSKPGTWSGKPYSVDAYGRQCPPLDRKAERWDALGAVTLKAPSIQVECAALRMLAAHVGMRPVVWTNRVATAADAVAALRGAAAREVVTP